MKNRGMSTTEDMKKRIHRVCAEVTPKMLACVFSESVPVKEF